MTYTEDIKKKGDTFVENQKDHAKSQKEDAEKQTEENAKAARKIGETLEGR